MRAEKDAEILRTMETAIAKKKEVLASHVRDLEVGGKDIIKYSCMHTYVQTGCK